MTSLFHQNNPASLQPPDTIADEQRTVLEGREREIAALKQQLHDLKASQGKGDPFPIDPLRAKPYFGEAPLGADHFRQRNDRMMAVLADRERQMKELQVEYKELKLVSAKELQKEKQANQAMKDEIAALHGQLEFLKKKYLEGQKRIAELSGALSVKPASGQQERKDPEDRA